MLHEVVCDITFRQFFCIPWILYSQPELRRIPERFPCAADREKRIEALDRFVNRFRQIGTKLTQNLHRRLGTTRVRTAERVRAVAGEVRRLERLANPERDVADMDPLPEQVRPFLRRL